MNNLLIYKNYTGSVNYSSDDDIFYGKIEFITDTVLYEGSSVEELKKNFREAVEDYIEACEEMGKEPQKPFKGKILARIEPELHKQAALIALQKRVSLNKFVESAIKHEIELNL
ncbi:MAG: type II toxin-antitoxin system HicB family antitoxin [Candidatus Aminicenantes bacterium]|nr:MAG: type II toxin-antitoxin system HicB family antitoxin [Candidatus Aminicenantes bacterium]